MAQESEQSAKDQAKAARLFKSLPWGFGLGFFFVLLGGMGVVNSFLIDSPNEATSEFLESLASLALGLVIVERCFAIRFFKRFVHSSE